MSQLRCKKCNDVIVEGVYRVSKKTIHLRSSQYKTWVAPKRRGRAFNLDSRLIAVYPGNVVDQKQLEFVPGHGCCGNSGMPFFCGCGAEIGQQQLDCYENRSVIFGFNRVELRHNASKG
jgi:hypothetical protein